MFNHRWAALSGIVFVVLMLVGAAFVADVPKGDASAQEIASYLTDSGNHTRNIIGAYLWVLGGLAFWGSLRACEAFSAGPRETRARSRTSCSAPGSSSPRSGVSQQRRSRQSRTPLSSRTHVSATLTW